MARRADVAARARRWCGPRAVPRHGHHGPPNRAFAVGNGDGDAWARLGDLDLPVVLATGDLDCGYLRDRTEELLARITGARRADLPGVAHLPSLERPDLVRAVVEDAVRTA